MEKKLEDKHPYVRRVVRNPLSPVYKTAIFFRDGLPVLQKSEGGWYVLWEDKNSGRLSEVKVDDPNQIQQYEGIAENTA